MKYATFIFLVLISFSVSRAQSAGHLDPETIHKPVDSTNQIVIQVEVAINSIRLLKIKSDSTVQTRDFTFKKGSTLNVSCLSGSRDDGAPEIFTKFNNEPEKRYHQPVRLVARGRHTLTVRAATENGGQSSLKISFTVIE